MKPLKGRVAVVTGAASGIGLAMAERIAAEAMKVVLANMEVEPLETVGLLAVARPRTPTLLRCGA
jgi:NAD(P)-dependent dehydrogenase (short-subunit alcohol dehydrogenase family)